MTFSIEQTNDVNRWNGTTVAGLLRLSSLAMICHCFLQVGTILINNNRNRKFLNDNKKQKSEGLSLLIKVLKVEATNYSGSNDKFYKFEKN